jgi:hypothetical protein
MNRKAVKRQSQIIKRVTSIQVQVKKQYFLSSQTTFTSQTMRLNEITVLDGFVAGGMADFGNGYYTTNCLDFAITLSHSGAESECINLPQEYNSVILRCGNTECIARTMYSQPDCPDDSSGPTLLCPCVLHLEGRFHDERLDISPSHLGAPVLYPGTSTLFLIIRALGW